MTSLTLTTETRPAYSDTSEWWKRPMRDASLMVRHGVNRIPEPIQNVVYDMQRGRTNDYLTQYARIVFALASVGGSFPHLCTPINTLKGLLWSAHFQHRVPCLFEAVQRETDANHRQNHATHQVLKDPHDAALDAFIASCDLQIAETRLARAAAMSRRHMRNQA